jgi:hypothetical protein
LTAEVHILHQRFEPFGLQRLFTDELAMLARVPGIVRDGVQIRISSPTLEKKDKARELT